MPLPASLRPFIIAPMGDNHNVSDLDSFVLASPKLDEMLRGFEAIPPDRTHRAETPSGTARGSMNLRGPATGRGNGNAPARRTSVARGSTKASPGPHSRHKVTASAAVSTPLLAGSTPVMRVLSQWMYALLCDAPTEAESAVASVTALLGRDGSWPAKAQDLLDELAQFTSENKPKFYENSLKTLVSILLGSAHGEKHSAAHNYANHPANVPITTPRAVTTVASPVFSYHATPVMPRPQPAFPPPISEEGTPFTRQLSGSASSLQSLMMARPRSTQNATYDDNFEDGTAQVNQYVLLQTIGRGAQGEVFLAMDTNENDLRAVKAVARPRLAGKGNMPAGHPLIAARFRQREQLEREVAIMKKFHHRNLVRLYEVIDDPELDRMYLVLQYVPNGALVTMDPLGVASRTIPFITLARYGRQIVAGLQYLHKHGVIHRDIKPENILLGNDDTVYLADFGMSEVFDMDATHHAITGTRGTVAFMAPELLRQSAGRPAMRSDVTVESAGAAASVASPASHDNHDDKAVTFDSVDGQAVDVWALGVTFYVLLYGTLPWAFASPAELYAQIADAPLRFPSRPSTPKDANYVAPRETSASGHDYDDEDEEYSGSMSLGDLPSPNNAAAATPGCPVHAWKALLTGMLAKDPKQRMALREVRRRLVRMIDRHDSAQKQMLQHLHRGPSITALTMRWGSFGQQAPRNSL
jgi:serine/threonine protein kinase